MCVAPDMIVMTMSHEMKVTASRQFSMIIVNVLVRRSG
jgi:hypothetical protein